MPAILGLKLTPLDTLFFRDGRPFSGATRGEGGLPWPRTLAGALRTRLVVSHGVDLRQFGQRRRQGQTPEAALRELGCPEWVRTARFRGPWLAWEKGNNTPEPLVPAPATLVRSKEKSENGLGLLHPWNPMEIPGWTDSQRWPLWLPGFADAKPAGGYLTHEGLNMFLNGNVPKPSHLLSPDDLYGWDERTGLEIQPDTLTGQDGQLYGIRLLALKPGVCLYAEVEVDGESTEASKHLTGPMHLGGEGRQVLLNVVPTCAWPQVPASGSRSMWLLTSPGPFGDPWQPAGFASGVTVRSLASGAPVAFSGWDVARVGPEPTRFAVPAGSVYFVEGDQTGCLISLCKDEDAAVGWGLALRGVWNDGK
jgi:CRISPR-associated protein Cmr3